jgi:hypothetical protein
MTLGMARIMNGEVDAGAKSMETALRYRQLLDRDARSVRSGAKRAGAIRVSKSQSLVAVLEVTLLIITHARGNAA